jgi:hypothetical protein
MTDLATDDRRAVAAAFMKRASRDTFRVCAQTAEAMAAEIEKAGIETYAPAALRLLASRFIEAARRE